MYTIPSHPHPTSSPHSPANEAPLLPSAVAAAPETAGECAGAVSSHQTSTDHLRPEPNSLPGQSVAPLLTGLKKAEEYDIINFSGCYGAYKHNKVLKDPYLNYKISQSHY